MRGGKGNDHRAREQGGEEARAGAGDEEQAADAFEQADAEGVRARDGNMERGEEIGGAFEVGEFTASGEEKLPAEDQAEREGEGVVRGGLEAGAEGNEAGGERVEERHGGNKSSE